LLNDDELQEIETAAVEIARHAGGILLEYFSGPLKIDYKSADNRNPVTDADHASDEYLRTEIAKRFPTHGIVTEETDPDEQNTADVAWVVDPLDGTSNFLNGLPLFGVLIAVLEQGRPVVSAIFLPDIHKPDGRVLHARRGGGAFDEDIPLSNAGELGGKRSMSAWPSYFLRMYTYKKTLRRRLGDVRSLGSAGYELAQCSRGVLDYVMYNGLWSWDLAAGLLLITEAGGTAFRYNTKTKKWSPFDRFSIEGSDAPPTLAELNVWRGTVALGRRESVALITSGITVPSYTWRRFKQRMTTIVNRRSS
jgi:myo-inositol-1(or 4)-monophosphatase